MTKLIYEELSYQVRDAAYQVHRFLGPGFREETYKRALLNELEYRKIQVEHEKAVPVFYKTRQIDTYRLDLVVEGKIVLELKAVEQFHPTHEAQLLSYLKASGLRVGLLVNFGAEKLQIIRRVN
jgi:GxxExxY protein